MRFFQYAVFIAALTFCGPVMAQEFLENYKQPMPEIKLAPQADFDAATTLHQDTPYDDKALSYQIRMPKDWHKQRDVGRTDAEIGNKIMGELVRFYGPPRGDVRSYLTIQAQDLEYQLTAEQWLIQYLLANSYTLQGIRALDDRQVEALYVYVYKDTTFAVRVLAHLNGKRVVMAQYYLPTEEWDAEKQQQAQVITSFKLNNDIRQDIESMEKYHFLDIAELSYPRSWKLKADPLKTIDRLNMQLLSVAAEEVVKRRKFKLLNGRVEVSLMSYYGIDSIADEVETFREQIKSQGLVVDGLIETVSDFKAHQDFDVRPVEVYKIIDTENNIIKYELWFRVMEAGDYYYFVSLLTPSRDEDYFLWSRNTQTFRLIIKSITPQADSLIGD
jgi:hypothetical protein